MTVGNPYPPDPTARKPGIASPLALMAIGILGTAAVAGVRVLGRDWSTPLDSLLAAPFGPEGVRPLHALVSGSFLLLVPGGLAWLLVRRPPPPGYEEVRLFQQSYQRLRVAILLLVLPLFAATGTWVWMNLKDRARWLDVWWGRDDAVHVALALFGGLTLWSALSLIARVRELRSPGTDGGRDSRPR